MKDQEFLEQDLRTALDFEREELVIKTIADNYENVDNVNISIRDEDCDNEVEFLIENLFESRKADMKEKINEAIKEKSSELNTLSENEKKEKIREITLKFWEESLEELDSIKDYVLDNWDSLFEKAMKLRDQNIENRETMILEGELGDDINDEIKIKNQPKKELTDIDPEVAQIMKEKKEDNLAVNGKIIYPAEYFGEMFIQTDSENGNPKKILHVKDLTNNLITEVKDYEEYTPYMDIIFLQHGAGVDVSEEIRRLSIQIMETKYILPDDARSLKAHIAYEDEFDNVKNEDSEIVVSKKEEEIKEEPKVKSNRPTPPIIDKDELLRQTYERTKDNPSGLPEGVVMDEVAEIAKIYECSKEEAEEFLKQIRNGILPKKEFKVKKPCSAIPTLPDSYSLMANGNYMNDLGENIKMEVRADDHYPLKMNGNPIDEKSAKRIHIGDLDPGVYASNMVGIEKIKNGIDAPTYERQNPLSQIGDM